jgi:hypothetical protein
LIKEKNSNIPKSSNVDPWELGKIRNDDEGF